MRWEFGTVVLASLRTPTSHMRMCLLESQLPFWFQLPGDVHSRRQLVMTHMLASPEPEWVHGEGTGRWESFGWPTPHPAGAGDRGKLPQWQTQVPKFQSWSWKSPHSPTASSNQSAHTTYTFVGQLAPHITRSSFHSIWLPPHMVAEPEPPQASLISIAWILLWYNDLGQFVLLLPGHLIGSLQSPCACMLTPSHSQSASPQQGGDHLWLYQVSRLRGMAGTQVWSLVVQGPDSPVSWGCCCFHVPAGVPGSGASNNLLQMSYNLQSVGWFLGICGVSLLFFIILRTFSCWIS